MGRKRTPGLYKRGAYWFIDKVLFGKRLRESTRTDSIQEAEKYLARRIEELRQACIYGVRQRRTFRLAATKYLSENQTKRSIHHDAMHLKCLDPYIGELNLDEIYDETLRPFIQERKLTVKNKTINLALQVVRRILNLAANQWVDEQRLTWLEQAPKITMLPLNDVRKPRQITWAEQQHLIEQLPEHLKHMVLFKVNTGCREQEVCQLQWDWEAWVHELEVNAFIIPAHLAKNGQERIIVLNALARKAVEQVRGQHPKFVFTYKGHPVQHINNSAWKRARTALQMDIRVHDLKHTFGKRLRAAGVGFEDRQDLLGHKTGSITTHYSAPEIANLLAAVEKICTPEAAMPTLVMRRKIDGLGSLGASSPQNSHSACGTGERVLTTAS